MDKQENNLYNRFSRGEETKEERAAIKHWLHHHNEEGLSGLTEEDLMDAQCEMWAEIKPVAQSTRIYKILKPVGIAATIIIALSIGIYFYSNQQRIKLPEQRIAKIQQEIQPGSNKAVLTLADGKKIVLTDAANGELAEQSGIRISKTSDGQLVYSVTELKSKSVDNHITYNTIETPRGGQYQINLPDGSTVWLNAMSSLRFPTRFTTNQRLVQLSGEGYFEIAHDKKRPFKVTTNLQEVQVLGTHFNINAYADEEAVKTTLLEGSVRVLKTKTQIASILKPNQQSILTALTAEVKSVDALASIDWKNGYFRFEDESLESIMRKVSRWYNVEVIYQNDKLKQEPFAGIITRFAKVSELLNMLELTNEVKFVIQDNHIIVKEKN